MRVLIVEDEPLIAISLASELEGAGHEVLGPANEPQHALSLAIQHRAEIALVDIGLHGTPRGVDLAHTLQEQCAIPVLFVTTQRALAHANADAAIGVITKPFNPADIAPSVQIARAVSRGEAPPARTIPRSLELFPASVIEEDDTALEAEHLQAPVSPAPPNPLRWR